MSSIPVAKPAESTPALALPAAGVARFLNVSERHLWALNSSGRLPKPIRLGRAVRWSVEELRAWLAAGSPERSRWEAIRKGGAA
ncbi:MAG TPA: helix-turn-helix domain-containing protein [Pirellulales bacterium]|jgi:predicted DNA-binding transcriptional regulator AlpA